MIFRLAIAIALIILSLWGCYYAARAGFAGAIARYAPETEFLLTASRLVPDNPNIHSQLGKKFLFDPDNIYLNGALKELQRATELAPNNYLIWLARAKAQERAGDINGTEQSLARATKLAPRYFEPRWQYANFLVRQNKFIQALPEFRAALAANQSQLGYGLELVWQISNHDLSVVESILPANSEAEMEYLQLLLHKHQYKEVVARWQRDISGDDKLANLSDKFKLSSDSGVMFARQLVTELIGAADFDTAYQIWQKLPEIQSLKVQPGQFTNGDFHTSPSKDEIGFGWQFDSKPKAKLSLDRHAPLPNGFSLRLDYSSEGSENFQHLSQLIPVKAGHSYRVSFVASSAEIVSGALPFIEISNAAGSALRVVIELKLRDTTDWQRYSAQFKVPADCGAIRVKLLRNAVCSVPGPCPIFGRAWFTDFQIEEIK